MMLLFQEQLEGLDSEAEKFSAATLAVRSLAATLTGKQATAKEVTLETDFAIIDNDHGEGLIVGDIGLRGFLQGVDCISVGKLLLPSITAEIDVVSLFPPSSPDDRDYIMLPGKAPIQHIRYVEYEAA